MTQQQRLLLPHGVTQGSAGLWEKEPNAGLDIKAQRRMPAYSRCEAQVQFLSLKIDKNKITHRDLSEGNHLQMHGQGSSLGQLFTGTKSDTFENKTENDITSLR